MPFTKKEDSAIITREMRRQKRRAIGEVYAGIIKISAGLQDLRDSTSVMRQAYADAGDKASVAECDRILAWLPSEVSLEPVINSENVREILSVFTRLKEEVDLNADTNVHLPEFTPLLRYRIENFTLVDFAVLDPTLWDGPQYAVYARTIENDPTVLYVGKTKRGLKVRLNEHLGYLRRGSERHNDWINFVNNKTVLVWGKASTSDTYLGEEDHLIQTLRPRFNKRLG